MTLILSPIPEPEYIPKYLFVSGDDQTGSWKSSHVMKECKNSASNMPDGQLLKAVLGPVLRKRNTIRRQKQQVARSQRRVLPWLRREDMEHTSERTDGSLEDAGSPESSCESTSMATTPQQSQWTSGSTVAESLSSPAVSSSGSLPIQGGHGASPDSLGAFNKYRELLDYCKRGPWPPESIMTDLFLKGMVS